MVGVEENEEKTARIEQEKTETRKAERMGKIASDPNEILEMQRIAKAKNVTEMDAHKEAKEEEPPEPTLIKSKAKDLSLSDFSVEVPTQRVFIPQLNGYVYISFPTAEDAVDMGLAKSDSNGGTEESKASMFGVIARCVRDRKGIPIFNTPEAVMVLRRQSAGTFKSMSSVINSMSDIGDEVEESVKD